MKNVSMEHFNHEKDQIWRAISELQDSPVDDGEKIKDILNKSKELYIEIESAHEHIRKYAEYVKYFQEHKTEIDAIKTHYEDTRDNINNAAVDIEELTKNISENNDASESFLESIESTASEVKSKLDESSSLLQKITTCESDAKTIKSKIDGYYKDTVDKNNSIEEIFDDVFGYETDQTGDDGNPIRQKGLVDTLKIAFDNLSKSISVTKQDNEESKSKLISWISEKSDEIEELLPNAMAAGLSSAFYNKKEDEILSYKDSSKLFNWAISGMCLASLIVIAVSAYLMNNGKTLIETIEILPRIAIGILPLYLPLLWLAFSASKRRNLSKRLIEEYTHKEVLAKTFVGLSKHISKSDDEDKNELRDALLDNIVKASAENPGELITGFNDAEHPILDMIKSIFNLKKKTES